MILLVYASNYSRANSGETGFHGQDFEMDSTFGAAIQATDKTLRALTVGVQRLFYHQGTINQGKCNKRSRCSNMSDSPPKRSSTGGGVTM